MLDNFCRTYQPNQRVALQEPENYRTVYTVIAVSVLSSRTLRLAKDLLKLLKIYQSKLLKPPKNWSKLEKYELGIYFKEDAYLKLSNLESRQYQRVINSEDAKSKPIPLKWVFMYKVDSGGFLIRYRARIVVRGNLQDNETIILTYAATLAARLFRIASTLAAYFDLEIKQFDVVNTFVNTKRDTRSTLVAAHLPDGFKQEGKYVEIDRALYSLRDSPVLQYRDFTSTLDELGLVGYKEEACIFIDLKRKVLVVFYIDNVQVLYYKKN